MNIFREHQQVYYINSQTYRKDLLSPYHGIIVPCLQLFSTSLLTRNSKVQGVWRTIVISMITKCKSDHRNDHNILEWESRFTLGLNAAKIPIISKNASNKHCSELNFLRKTQWTHFSIYPKSRAMGL